MKEVLLNEELALTYPEGFAAPGEEEMQKLQFLNKGPGEVLFDPDRHIMQLPLIRRSAVFRRCC